MSIFVRLFAAITLLLIPAVNAAESALPRILFLGDGVQQKMMADAAKELKGRVQIEYPATPANDTGDALARIDELLGDGKWDLIYFNFGLGDLFYKDPRTKEIRTMSKLAGGVRVTSPEQYGKNLAALVSRLKSTRAKLIWASTTPIPDAAKADTIYDAGSEVEYNQIAAQVMARHQVTVNDIHSQVLKSSSPDEKRPGNRDKNPQAGSPLQESVVQAILGQLGNTVPESSSKP